MVPEHRLFIALSDGELFCADLDTYSTKKPIGRAKGASFFAVDWQTIKVQCERQELRICVVTKKKLNFYEYKRGEFLPYKVCKGSRGKFVPYKLCRGGGRWG